MPGVSKVRLVLIRNTEVVDDSLGNYPCQGNSDMTSAGSEQAKTLVHDIRERFGDIAGIFASDSSQTRELGGLFSFAFEQHVVFDPRLREIDVGRISGKTRKDARIHFPEKHHQLSSLYFDFHSVGGECWHDAMMRFRLAVNSTIECGVYNPTCDDEIPTVLLVSHMAILERFFVRECSLLDQLHEQGSFDTIVWEIHTP